jgi:acetolactate synthase-1/2/3 large subunit
VTVARSVSETLADVLADLGAIHAFGLLGGGVAPIYDAIARSSLHLVHCRHETGAAFAALEASLASGRPSVVFATAGPGITNTLTGLHAALQEGGRVVLIAGTTSAAQRGRGAFQETTQSNLPGVFVSGSPFHYGESIEDAAQVTTVAHRLALGMARPGGFVATIAVPVALQSALVAAPIGLFPRVTEPSVAGPKTLQECADLLRREPFAIWVGFGARGAAAAVRELAERTGAMVLSTPRGKGVFPEDHPQFAGVTGMGGHRAARDAIVRNKPTRMLVLGSRLGEFSSFWDKDLIPPQGMIHVDVDPDVPGIAFSTTPVWAIQSEIKGFVRGLLAELDRTGAAVAHPVPVLDTPFPAALERRTTNLVRPAVLMSALQSMFVDPGDTIILTEAGNAFAWTTHHLAFRTPGRYRVSVGFGSMGHATTGVIGAALGGQCKAVAVVGDGAMLMQNELSTAATYGIDAVWVVLNDGRYNMTEQGMRSVGLDPHATGFHEVDFVATARALGADGVRVDREGDLAAALTRAREAKGPFVVDVHIDPTNAAPVGARNKNLLEQWRAQNEDEQ